MSHLGLLLALFWAAPVERIVRIDVPSHEAVYPLLRKTGLAVIDAQDRFVTAYADDEMISRVQALGYKVTVLVEDYQQQATVELQAYHTYPQVCSIMNGLALVHPEICRLETLGFSAGNRPIPALKVTESPGIESGRPVIRLIGAHHGNEKISTEITLAFMQLLGDSYPTNQQVRALVDTREFWIIPILNPDGHVANRRTNDALVDLNRDYGYEWEVYSSPFTQPETRALLYHAELHPPTLEFAYHSSASYCNYLWDNTPVDPPDSAWIIALSRRYCDSTYGSSLTRLTPINGWDWYEVHGSCQDYTFGACGGLAWTIETRQPSTRAGIDSICLANRRALLDMATIAGWGISGHVYDSLTGAPLFARIEFQAPERWNCYANRATGVFHKMLTPGTYNIRVRANGYNPKSFTGVVVPDTGAAVLDVALTRPDTEPVNYVQKIVAVRRNDENHLLAGVAPDCLGEPDSRFYLLGPSPSSIILEVDPNIPIGNRPGDDLVVLATGSYSVAAANEWRGEWRSLGTGTGDQSFDLALVGLDSARFLRLTDNGSAAIDAIGYRRPPGSGISQPLAAHPRPSTKIAVFPTVAKGWVNILLPQEADHRPLFAIHIFDALGRQVRSVPVTTRDASFVISTAGLAPGVYFCGLDAASPGPAKMLVAR